MVVELFTSSQCIGCDIVKKILKKENIKFKEIDIDTKEGYDYFNKLDVSIVPLIKIENKLILAPITESQLKKIKEKRI